MKYKALSIAGFDGSGGAGIQADLKTFSALGCYGMTILTALPVQNTLGVKRCYEIPLSAISDQLWAIFEDIKPDAIKVGMLFSTEIINLVADFLERKAKDIPLVLDPVMVAKSGDRLLFANAVGTLKDRLLPLATLITPNFPEAQALICDYRDIKTAGSEAMKLVAYQLLALGPEAVLIKGGHLNSTTSDDLYLSRSGEEAFFKGARIDSKNTHGTGCTLSAAITSGLAQGLPLMESCRIAKLYLSKALAAAKDLSVGHGHGPVHHFYHLWPSINKI